MSRDDTHVRSLSISIARWIAVLCLCALCGCDRHGPRDVLQTSLPADASQTNSTNAAFQGETDEDLKAYEKVYRRETPEMYAQRFTNNIQKDGYFEHRHPINFWGRVVDQNGRPLEGETVNP